MTRKILVAVDLSSEMPREAKFADALATDLGAELILYHAIDYVPTLLPVELPGGYPLPQLDIVRSAATTKLERIRKGMKCPKVRAIVDVGGAATEIIECAKREKVDQIVIGSHSHSGIARMVLGSVADRVAHTATVPVTIVRDISH
jgi:nucleotide-binding universal stress UspA family protein